MKESFVAYVYWGLCVAVQNRYQIDPTFHIFGTLVDLDSITDFVVSTPTHLGKTNLGSLLPHIGEADIPITEHNLSNLQDWISDKRNECRYKCQNILDRKSSSLVLKLNTNVKTGLGIASQLRVGS